MSDHPDIWCMLYYTLHNAYIEQLDSSVYKIKWCFFGILARSFYKSCSLAMI